MFLDAMHLPNAKFGKADWELVPFEKPEWLSIISKTNQKINSVVHARLVEQLRISDQCSTWPRRLLRCLRALSVLPWLQA